MDLNEIISRLDHTVLSPTATEDDIMYACDEAARNHTATLCVAPCYVKFAKAYARGRVPISTVVGFPNGYAATETKVYETGLALTQGAEEIDLMTNICYVKQGDFDSIEKEIALVKKVCGDRILKVIIECSLLNRVEKIRMCQTASVAGADYIKTSTGFFKSGAAIDDIILIRNYSAENIKIKASGGIGSIEEAEKFISIGADRLGSSTLLSRITEKRKYDAIQGN